MNTHSPVAILDLEDAIALASALHRGQRDKAGAPYILHPLRVMLSLGPNASESARIAAVLHDVVEDCGVTLEELSQLGVSPDALRAIDGVTRRETETYDDFIARLTPDALARQVKLADLCDNLDLSRIAHPTPRDYERLERYCAAVAALEAANDAGT